MKITIDEAIKQAEDEGILKKRTNDELRKDILSWQTAYFNLVDTYKMVVEQYNLKFKEAWELREENERLQKLIDTNKEDLDSMLLGSDKE